LGIHHGGSGGFPVWLASVLVASSICQFAGAAIRNRGVDVLICGHDI
jgi:hypothetical protein